MSLGGGGGILIGRTAPRSRTAVTIQPHATCSQYTSFQFQNPARRSSTIICTFRYCWCNPSDLIFGGFDIRSSRRKIQHFSTGLVSFGVILSNSRKFLEAGCSDYNIHREKTFQICIGLTCQEGKATRLHQCMAKACMGPFTF